MTEVETFVPTLYVNKWDLRNPQSGEVTVSRFVYERGTGS